VLNRSPRVEALLESAKKVNAHFFSSSSDEEGGEDGEESEDDDIIPHTTIPDDMQPIDDTDGRDAQEMNEDDVNADFERDSDVDVNVDADNGHANVHDGEGYDRAVSDCNSELAGLDFLSSPESVLSKSALSALKYSDSPARSSRTLSTLSGDSVSAPSTPTRPSSAPEWLGPGPSGSFTPSAGTDSNAPTPPARQKHSEAFLVNAGLLHALTERET